MRGFRYGLIRGAQLLLVVNLASLIPVAYAGPGTKADLTSRMPAYLQEAWDQYESSESAMEAALPGWVPPAGSPTQHMGDPEHYEGNSLALGAFFEDWADHITEDFFSCLGFESPGTFCMDGWSPGVKVSYRFPVMVVDTTRFWTSRHLDPIIPNFINDTYPSPLNGFNSFNSFSQDMIQGGFDVHGFAIPGFYDLWRTTMPLRHDHGYLEVQQELNTRYPGIYVSGPGPLAQSVSSDLIKSARERQRFADAPIAFQNRLEYEVHGTIFEEMWCVLKEIPVLGCFVDLFQKPPRQEPAQVLSHLPQFIEFTRDPHAARIFNDPSLNQDLNQWITNPHACVEYQMNQSKSGVMPHDMYAPDGVAAILQPDLITPMSNGDLGAYENVCHEKLGGVIPFTTTNHQGAYGVEEAQRNFLKAQRFSEIWFKEFICTNVWCENYGYHPDRKAFAYEPGRDKIQFVGGSNTPSGCMNLGSPSVTAMFNNANTHTKQGSHGQYTITLWKRQTDCVSVAEAAELGACIFGVEVPIWM